MIDSRSIGIDPVHEESAAQWTITIDGNEINRLKTRYEDRVSEEEWETVRETAAIALSHCPSPLGPASTVTGLSLGKVQSGKTLSYTALIALAIDNGYRVTMVLVGTKNALLEQNSENVHVWLEQVATGSHGKEPAPEKALDLLAKLAEFAAPKLARTEVVGDAEKPLTTVIKWSE